MIDEDTYETTHLLNYPDLSVKESSELFITMVKLALLRLYQKDENELWLKL